MRNSDVSNKPETRPEGVTAGPWGRGMAAVARVQWTEPSADGSVRARQEVFDTKEQAETYKRELEATGIVVTLG
jgi:hypothetical protein